MAFFCVRQLTKLLLADRIRFPVGQRSIRVGASFLRLPVLLESFNQFGDWE